MQLGPRGAVQLALFDWMLEGTERAFANQRFREVFPGGATHAFVFRAHGERPLLAGAVTPSADQAARAFPLAVASEIEASDRVAAHPELLPVALESLWLETSEWAGQLCRGTHEPRQLEALGAAMPVAVDDALRAYRSWMTDLPVRDLLAMVFDSDVRAAGRSLGTLIEAVYPHRNVESPNTPLSLLLPLGAAGGAAVCFWLDVARRASGWRRTIPSFFWSHDGRSGSLMLHLGSPPASSLEELWLPTGSRDEICDLISAPDDDWIVQPPKICQGPLESDSAVLVELLDAIECEH